MNILTKRDPHALEARYGYEIGRIRVRLGIRPLCGGRT